MCVYLNIDGVVYSSSSFSTASGVIHDGKGTWIFGYNRFLGKCSFMVAELWSNNLENVISISDRKIEGTKISLIRRIQQILAFKGKWSLRYIPSETN
ncbi:hypothetical protein Golob_006240 [Gossypium lobatum]|uniref:RNase H type-1 domain-containing protein n=1 Tax=Gossypium lobatum TaxID=34289 RepID=A0A7J8MW28_9ROSI|nr:hypothetical protein [Gossypium lobatum]